MKTSRLIAYGFWYVLKLSTAAEAVYFCKLFPMEHIFHLVQFGIEKHELEALFHRCVSVHVPPTLILELQAFPCPVIRRHVPLLAYAMEFRPF